VIWPTTPIGSRLDRLAGVGDLELGDLVRVLVERVGELEQQGGAVAGGRLLEALEGGGGGRDGAVDVLGAGQRLLGKVVAGGGVDDREGLVARRVDVLAADEVLQRAYSGGHGTTLPNAEGWVAILHMKLLVLAPHAVDAATIRSRLPKEELGDAEVLVVSPALQKSGLRFWMSDSDDAIVDAERAAAATADALRPEAGHVRAQTGESEPLVAIQDALATFPADRIIVFRGDDDAYREEQFAEARERFDVPVEFA
jgi:hypothetical protein